MYTLLYYLSYCFQILKTQQHYYDGVSDYKTEREIDKKNQQLLNYQECFKDLKALGKFPIFSFDGLQNLESKSRGAKSFMKNQ